MSQEDKNQIEDPMEIDSGSDTSDTSDIIHVKTITIMPIPETKSESTKKLKMEKPKAKITKKPTNCKF